MCEKQGPAWEFGHTVLATQDLRVDGKVPAPEANRLHKNLGFHLKKKRKNKEKKTFYLSWMWRRSWNHDT